MEIYNAFARLYDRCMDNVPYDDWMVFLEETFRKFGVPGDGIVVELGCGTGEISGRLRERGYDIIGVDASEEMLSVAMEKEYDWLDRELERAGFGIDNAPENSEAEDELVGRLSERMVTYLQQDLRNLDLYGTAAAMVSVCDTLNYITDTCELTEIFRRVNRFLDRDGLFVFDLKTETYFRDVLGDNVRAEDYGDAVMLWDNRYDSSAKINEYRVSVFEENEDGLYSRSDEVHVQRAFSEEEIRECLNRAGLALVGMYDGYSDRPADAKTERLVVIAREQFQNDKYYGES